MATTQFCFTTAENGLPFAYNANSTWEVKTPSGSSGATTAAATGGQNLCRVATDTAVYVTFAASPTATSTTGFLVPANGVEYFRVKTGDKAAVITI
jgi:hypothetical protein